MTDTALSASDIITSRRSVRGFLPDLVDRALIVRLLELARWAPSGNNIQPWNVHVVIGNRRDALAQALSALFEADEPPADEYPYYPAQWRSPYIDRRRETGWSLYGTLGIKKGDYAATKRQHARNFRFFDAPVALFFAIDKDLALGSWLDYGMFIQNVMIAARALGLHTCPQAALNHYPDVVREHLGLTEDQMLVCGMALGYEDVNEPANTFRTTRLPVSEFTTFHED